MSNNYDRKAYIRGIDFESITGVFVDTIRADSIPDRNVNSTQLAYEDGEVVLGATYGAKKIYVKGHIYLDDRWDYEEARDAILNMLDSDAEVDMTYEYRGALRRTVGIYENVEFEYVERGLAMFTITYRSTKPFALAVEETTVLFGELMTDTVFERQFNVTGNVYTFPRIVLALNDYVKSGGGSSTITVEMTSESKTYRMVLFYGFSTGQSVVIDGSLKKPQVSVNGVKIAYTGRFPRAKGITNLKITHDADTATVDVQVRYNERNM